MNREDFKELRSAWRIATREEWSRDDAIRFRLGEIFGFTPPPPLEPIPLSFSEPVSDELKRHRTALFQLRSMPLPFGWYGVWGRWMGRDGKWAPVEGPWRKGQGPFDDLDLRKEADLAQWGRGRAA